MRTYDYIIAGSGIAGLYAALLAREHGSVLILTKGSIDECNTRYAQGGIAAAVGPDDSPELHLRDTIEAGAGLVDEEAARILVYEAADRIRDLVRFGVPFDSIDGEVALGREGAHSRSRILHAGGDATGAHIELSLSSLARLSRVAIKEYCQVEDLLVENGRAVGVATLDSRTNSRETFEGWAIVLATGGCGQLYRVSTNPALPARRRRPPPPRGGRAPRRRRPATSSPARSTPSWPSPGPTVSTSTSATWRPSRGALASRRSTATAWSTASTSRRSRSRFRRRRTT